MGPIDWRSFLTSGVLSICFVATCANRVLAFHHYGNKISFSSHTFLWIWIIFIPDLIVLFILYLLLFYIGWKYPQYNFYGILVGLVYAIFIILVSSCNIIMLTITGRNIDWRIVFEVDFTATYSLYIPHLYSFLSLLLSHFLLGSTIWSIINHFNQIYPDLHYVLVKIMKIFISTIILLYLIIILFDHLPQSYKNSSSNMILSYFHELISYYWRTIVFMSFHTGESIVNSISEAIRAPSINISDPIVTLKKPIKNVFLIILESIRADVLPLNEHFLNATQSTFTSDLPLSNITPILNSFWKNSLRTVASTTSSYTLKSLVSIFCGIYPLNLNFLKEVNDENIFYEKCLPELLQQTFKTKNNQSKFRSAFFTSARGDFDHQRELIQKFKFDSQYDGFDIIDHSGYVPDLGMFGPADPNILPLLWKWLDETLAEEDEEENHQLMMSLLITGTHEPFHYPDDRSYTDYPYYTNDPRINAYLNTLRITDELFEKLIHGFKSRKLYDETLFIIVSDHGYVFNDYGSQTVGLLSSPLESAFAVPLIFHNKYLQSKQLHGQYSTMDILPTIMDILLSSRKKKNKKKKSSNQLLSSVENQQLKTILSLYEGTSILRRPIQQESIRYIFNLANPGNSFISVKQYPRKLTYDITNDEVHLYHLQYDPSESIDLINLYNQPIDNHPSWIHLNHFKQIKYVWKGRWISKTIRISMFSQILSEKNQNNHWLIPKSVVLNNSKIDLDEMLNWADRTFELTRLWTKLVFKRYRTNNPIDHQ